MKLKYVTQREAEKAAKKGDAEAIKYSAIKWWFYGTCSEADFTRAMGYAENVGANCSLCFAYREITGECDGCPLYKKTGMECGDTGSLFDNAWDASCEYIDDMTKANFKKFQGRARKLARVIDKSR